MLKKIRSPVMVFAGSEDPLYRQLDATCELLEEAEREEIAGARTFVCETHTDTVAGLLSNFFQGVAA